MPDLRRIVSQGVSQMKLQATAAGLTRAGLRPHSGTDSFGSGGRPPGKRERGAQGRPAIP